MSASESPSISPSVVEANYTRGTYASLPTNDDALSTAYSAQDVLDVQDDDGIRVEESALTDYYVIHQFKDEVPWTSASFTCNCQSSIPCGTSEVFLQIYNRISLEWETIDSDNTSPADIDFTLNAVVLDLSDYKDGGNMVSCRVYQRAQ